VCKEPDEEGSMRALINANNSTLHEMIHVKFSKRKEPNVN